MSDTDHSVLARLREALDRDTRMVLHLDEQDVVVWLNDTARTVLRSERVVGEIEGRELCSLTPSLGRGLLAAALLETRTTGERQRFRQAFPSGLLVEFTVLPASGHLVVMAQDVSPRDLQVRQSGQLTAVLEASFGEMWIYDPLHDTVTTWSDDAATVGEATTRPLDEVLAQVPPSDQALIRARQEQALRDRLPYELSHRWGDGLLTRHFQVRGAPVELEGRRQLVGVSLDVTGLDGAERTAQRTYERFLRASEALGLGLWEVDLATGTLSCSPVTQTMFGLPKPMISVDSTSVDVQVHPDDRDEVYRRWKRCVEHTGRYEVTFRVRGAEGDSWRWVSSVGERVVGPAGAALVAGWVQDVTQERGLQELHLVTEEMAQIGGWLLDLDSEQVYWTAGTYKVLGMDPSQPPPNGGDIVGLHAPEDQERVRELYQRSVKYGESYAYVATMLRRDGSRRRVHVRGEPAMSDGRVFQVVGAVQDVTEREALEGELRRSQRLDSLGRMAGGVAHDFNNVLTAISGNAELILAAQDLGSTREFAEEVLLATRRGNALTRQMMNFARDGMREPGGGATEVVAATEQVVGMLHRLLPATAKLEVDLPDRELHVALDDGRFEQLLMNLILNARDALVEAGTIGVHVAALSSGSDELVCLTVQDDGVGMSPETQEHMFEPFFTTRPGAGGTGLGLATVYRVVTAAGGRLQVQSRLGSGTTIEVWLPRAEPPTPPAVFSEPESLPSPGRIVLLAEDDDVVRRMVKRVLQGAGYEVFAMADGAAAFAAVNERGLPDVLITDVDMPGLTGVELSVLLRARDPQLPLVFISSHPNTSRPFDDPRVRFLRKPFDLPVLEKAVADVLAYR